MTDSTPFQNTRADVDKVEAVLDEDQQAYEALFGLVPEWHATPGVKPETPDTDDDLYRALFGA